MKDVEHFRWMLPPNQWSKKPYASRWEMSREEAEKRYPGATPIQWTRVVRRLCETEEEFQAQKDSRDVYEAAAGQKRPTPPTGRS